VSTAYDGKQRKLYKLDCAYCGSSFLHPRYKGPKYRARKYCSVECRRQATSPKIYDLKCDTCGIMFKRSQSNLSKSKSGLRFCSRKCKDEAQRLESNNPEIHPPHYGTGVGPYREVAFRHHPSKCNRCGYDEHVGILKVHHRNRDRSNSDPENLEILCPNCHDLEHYLAKDGMYSGGKPRGRGETEITELLQSSVESLSLSASTKFIRE
jgi:5-methylcytosine-specific restriction endonuclease McrA